MTTSDLFQKEREKGREGTREREQAKEKVEIISN